MIGYLRVSTPEQDVEKNKADMLYLANEKQLGSIHFVEEQVSGRVHWKKRQVGDVISQLSQATRSLSASFPDWVEVC